jgi:hypothetical protein
MLEELTIHDMCATQFVYDIMDAVGLDAKTIETVDLNDLVLRVIGQIEEGKAAIAELAVLKRSDI